MRNVLSENGCVDGGRRDAVACSAMGLPELSPVDPLRFCPIQRPDDPRLAERAHAMKRLEDIPADAVVLIGIPDDRGVEAGYGRPGAKEGPKVFRDCFYRLPLGAAGDLAHTVLYDAGNIIPAGSSEATHEQVAAVVAAVARRGALTCLIGGGQDATYGSVKGLLRAGKKIALLSIDAHLDMRPPEASGAIGSGTAIRRLLTDRLLLGPQIAIVGVQRHAVAPLHMAFAAEHRVRLWTLADLEASGPSPVFAGLLQDLARQHGRIAVSVDLDAIAAAEAPGVSAINPTGFTSREVIRMMELAGMESTVRHLEIMELNPRFDPTGKTARLAALLLWTFLAARASAGTGAF